MWPWEHAIFAYLLYSIYSHLRYREAPDGRVAVVLVVAAVLPDVIDKPLAWEFGVFSTGYALGHSLFFAVPLSFAMWLLAWGRGSPRLGTAFGIGYLSHLVGDVLPIYVLEGEWTTDHLLWPIVVTSSHDHGQGFADRFLDLFLPYYHELTGGDPSLYTRLVLGMGVLTLLLWIYDGMPVLRELASGTRRLCLRTLRALATLGE
ncbi:metal-dependent hydrolase [Natronorarus salvus]|uniref:metal-dependent hydrolase n=1 Tax=Natronorarus salvus TaxID=3117733 RepID=UPI002F26A27B